MSLRRLPTKGDRVLVGVLLLGLAFASAWFSVSHLVGEPRDLVISGVLALFAALFALMAERVFFERARVPSRRWRHAVGWFLIALAAGTSWIALMPDTPLEVRKGLLLYILGMVGFGARELADRRRR